MKNHPIQINRDTLEERVWNVTPELPYMANLCWMNELPDGMFPWHWHGEVELFYMRSGASSPISDRATRMTSLLTRVSISRAARAPGSSSSMRRS